MPNSTRDHFYDAIAGAPTPKVAAGVVKAMHAANMRELFEQLDELLQGNLLLEHSSDMYSALKAEYTTV